MKKPEKLIQTYVLEQVFVSTIYRQSSAMVIPALWYYETIAFDWDKNTRECGEIIEMDDNGSDPLRALEYHNKICEKIAQRLLTTAAGQP